MESRRCRPESWRHSSLLAAVGCERAVAQAAALAQQVHAQMPRAAVADGRAHRPRDGRQRGQHSLVVVGAGELARVVGRQRMRRGAQLRRPVVGARAFGLHAGGQPPYTRSQRPLHRVGRHGWRAAAARGRQGGCCYRLGGCCRGQHAPKAQDAPQPAARDASEPRTPNAGASGIRAHGGVNAHHRPSALAGEPQPRRASGPPALDILLALSTAAIGASHEAHAAFRVVAVDVGDRAELRRVLQGALIPKHRRARIAHARHRPGLAERRC